jgi:hypothetical protein
MIVIIPYLLIVAACVYVLYPLFAERKIAAGSVSQERIRFRDLIHQKRLIADSLSDLEFDRQTGKLSEEDYSELFEEQLNMKAEIEKKLEPISGIDRLDLQRKLEAEISAVTQKSSQRPSLKCPQCGQIVRVEDKYCSGCGRKLAS